ncbi:MAG: type I secretion protein, partial [Pseudomonadota bacterium]
MATFLAFGSDILRNPNLSTQSGGQDGAGQITVNSGTSMFPSDYVIEFTAQDLDSNGEFTSNTKVIGIKVYASQADFVAGTVTYTYTPQNPGQYAQIQDSLDRLGDTYLRFTPNVLTSSDPGAP